MTAISMPYGSGTTSESSSRNWTGKRNRLWPRCLRALSLAGLFAKPVCDCRHADPPLGRIGGKSLAKNAGEWFGRVCGIVGRVLALDYPEQLQDVSLWPGATPGRHLI